MNLGDNLICEWIRGFWFPKFASRDLCLEISSNPQSIMKFGSCGGKKPVRGLFTNINVLIRTISNSEIIVGKKKSMIIELHLNWIRNKN